MRLTVTSIAFTATFSLGGALFLIVGVLSILQGREAAEWPTTTGIVEFAEMSHPTTRKGGITHAATIVYGYNLDGIRYSSSRVSFAEHSTGNPAHAQEVLNRYHKGAHVTVHYRPDDPSTAVLETDFSKILLVLPSAGLLLAAIGFVAGRSIWRQRNRREASRACTSAS